MAQGGELVYGKEATGYMSNTDYFQRCPYDAWLHWYVTLRCFLDCDYCGTHQSGLCVKGDVEPIRIEALIRALAATGKIFSISFTGGGEPFMVPNLLEACQEIVKKHYISFNSNLVHKNAGPFFAAIDSDRVVFVHASCHIKALERAHLVDLYADNYQLCQQRGITIRAMEVGHPALIAEAQKYRDLFAAKGVDLHFGPFSGAFEGKSYPQSYTDGELEILGLDPTFRDRFEEHNARGVFMCNAGYNAAIVRPNGDIFPCDHIQKRMGNIYEKIEFAGKMTRCPIRYCSCPLYKYDPLLFARAQKEKRLNNLQQTRVEAPLGCLYDRLYAVFRPKG